MREGLEAVQVAVVPQVVTEQNAKFMVANKKIVPFVAQKPSSRNQRKSRIRARRKGV